MSLPLSSRIALITGAASGLGRATAERFVKQGAKVVLCDLPSSEGLALEQALLKEASSSNSSNSSSNSNSNSNNNAAAIFVPTDVTQPEQVTEALNAAERLYGKSVNTVVNCAGIVLAEKTVSSKAGSVHNVHDLDRFEQVMHVNLVGTFNVIRLAVERMVKAKEAAATVTDNNSYDNTIEYGTIVNTASIAAYDGQMGQVAYSASKGAIVGMTLPLARDLASYGIRVNTIAPGLFRTPLLEGLPKHVQNELAQQVPFPSRLGHSDEFAQLVQSIVENPMINAEVIRIDGGIRMPFLKL